MKKPNIYNYHEYRVFLKDYFRYLKKIKKITAKEMAKKLDISAALLSMIISGKRSLDELPMTELSKICKFNDQEISFFRSLLVLNDSDDAKQRSIAYKRLTRFKQFKKLNDEELITHKYLDKWYYVAIRELSFLSDFKAEPFWIQNRLRIKIKIEEIKKALRFLKKNDMLGDNSGHLDCSEGIYKLSLANYHKQMLQISAESIEEVSREKRQILAFTKSLSPAGHEEAKRIIEKTLRELENIKNDDSEAIDEKELYHFHLINVPLTGD